MFRYLNKYYQTKSVFDFTRKFIRLNAICLCVCLIIALIGFLKPAQTAHLVALTALCTGLINISFLTAKPLSRIAVKHMAFDRFFDIWQTILDIELVMLIDLLICIAIIILS